MRIVQLKEKFFVRWNLQVLAEPSGWRAKPQSAIDGLGLRGAKSRD